MIEKRVEVTWNDHKYFIRPLKEQNIMNGFVQTDSESPEGYLFKVDKENRQEVLDAMIEIEDILSKEDLALTDVRLSRLFGKIEGYFRPPVEVTGLKIILETEA